MQLANQARNLADESGHRGHRLSRSEALLLQWLRPPAMSLVRRPAASVCHLSLPTARRFVHWTRGSRCARLSCRTLAKSSLTNCKSLGAQTGGCSGLLLLLARSDHLHAWRPLHRLCNARQTPARPVALHLGPRRLADPLLPSGRGRGSALVNWADLLHTWPRLERLEQGRCRGTSGQASWR